MNASGTMADMLRQRPTLALQAKLQACLKEIVEKMGILPSPPPAASRRRQARMVEGLLLRSRPRCGEGGEYRKADVEAAEMLCDVFNGDWTKARLTHHCVPGRCRLKCESSAHTKDIAYAALLNANATLGSDVSLPSINRWPGNSILFLANPSASFFFPGPFRPRRPPGGRRWKKKK